jgi:ATP-dependent Lhr-like helicase
MNHSMSTFHPAVAAWFEDTFGSPTPPQALGWPKIAAGHNVLLLAPTGSGKTLSAFLKCLDWLVHEADAGRSIDGGVRILYVSPLKALNNDIRSNLELPLNGIVSTGKNMGINLPELRVGVRTGDTPQSERARMQRKPPHILITTPESLFLLLSSKTREILKTVRFVIIDEIHTLFPTKRGAHLSLSLARLQHLTRDFSPQKIGLSATMRPLDQIAAYLGGRQWDPKTNDYKQVPVEIIDTGQRKELDLQILLPVPDLSHLPEKSIWPPVYEKLVELIREHRTTLIFVNNRRLGERLTAQINQLAGQELARAHHGSVSKEVRQDVESMLKEGTIPCIVATSSLELGIDIGHIDLVVQIESPKEVARGLQRVGRAGHVIGMPSKGRIIPKTRGDLLEAVAIIREMRQGAVEFSRAPMNCLDVLAQHLVAMTVEGEWRTDDCLVVVRTAYNFGKLSESDFQNTLGMLAGVYDGDRFLDLRPRLFWDRTAGIIQPEPYGKRLVYSSGGTIPDRAYFGVYLQGSDVRLGELDEEFVYERRLNERFVLGTSLWKIEEIRQDRVIVSPAQRGEAVIPFWKADQNGRPYELGKRIGAFYRELEIRLDEPDFAGWLQRECGVDQETASNLHKYLSAQKRSVGLLATDQRLVLEEFPDEAGDWRLLLHSPYGSRIHAALGLLIHDHWLERHNIELEVVPTDDGVMFHCPGGQKAPSINWKELPFEELEERLACLVGKTALFGSIFRHCAQRSLVMPRTGYEKKRTPLWLSRLKAGNLLQSVADIPDFPLVIETYREVLQDHFDLLAVREFFDNLRNGTITFHHCRHEHPSPFAHGHLLSFVDSFMYESDAPKGERRLQLFGLGHETLKTLIGERGFRDLFVPSAVLTVSRKAMGVHILESNPSPEAVAGWLERIGDILPEELDDLFPSEVANHIQGFIKVLVQNNKAVVCLFKEERQLTISSSYLSTYSSALDNAQTIPVQPDLNQFPAREPQISRDEARCRIIRRYARTHGPFRTEEISDRYGFHPDEVVAELMRLAAEGILEKGAFLPGGKDEEWCDRSLLQEIHRRSLAHARKEIEPKGVREYGLFLAHWQELSPKRKGLDGLAETLDQLQGLWLPAAFWEGSVLPNRIADYSSTMLDQLITSGQFTWRAKGGSDSLEIAFFSEYIAKLSLTTNHAKGEDSTSDLALRIQELLLAEGALSLPQILQRIGGSSAAAWEALEHLMTSGVVTNDSYGPVRYILKTSRNLRIGARGIMSPSTLAKMGRWSVLFPQPIEVEEEIRQLLGRYGILTRSIVSAEGRLWGELLPILELWEATGKIRRGYFVDGLGGLQYANPDAVELLRNSSSSTKIYWTLLRNDPANSRRFLTSLEESGRHGDWLLFVNGELILEATGTKKIAIRLLKELGSEELKKAFGAFIPALRSLNAEDKVVLSRFNDKPILESEHVSILEELGFERTYRELVLWPSQI